MSALAVAAPIAAGTGTAMVGAWWRARAPRFDQRIAPHVRGRDGANWASRGATAPASSLGRLAEPIMRDALRLVARFGSSARDVEARLRRAGLGTTVEQFRSEQLLWAVGALVAGVALSAALLATRGGSPLAMLVMCAAFAVAGAAGRDWALTRTVRAREERIVAELPAIAEILAISVSAGEGALGALERVTRLTQGALADDLRRVLADVRAGMPLADALMEMARVAGVPPVRRFAEGVAVAVERGTPLAEVLYAQALDVREAGKRQLMETGGKKEIAMMIPVVFLILPVTVVFAVFPGIVAISLTT